jgi:hypothetical protein
MKDPIRIKVNVDAPHDMGQKFVESIIGDIADHLPPVGAVDSVDAWKLFDDDNEQQYFCGFSLRGCDLFVVIKHLEVMLQELRDNGATELLARLELAQRAPPTKH